MSKIRSLLLKNPKVAAKFMTGMPATFWERSGDKNAVRIFQLAAAKVASYRDFLASEGVDPAAVRTIEDFKRLVPVSDKSTHFAGRTLDDLLAVPISDTYLFYMSGGTTGDSLLAGASRQTLRAYPPSIAAILDMQWDVCDPKNRVLIVNAMSMGAWIAGTMGSCIFMTMCDQHPNISYAGPGADADRLLDIVSAVHSRYDTIVLVSYPSFIKEVLHAGTDRGLDWASMNIKVMASGERLDDTLRQEILRTISDPIDYHALIDQYGASEMGSPGSETPLASTIIRLAREDSALCQAIFGSDEPQTLLQTNPAGTYIEVIDGKVLATTGTFMPIVRYSPKDLGRAFRYDEMGRILLEHGIDIRKRLADDGWTKPVFRWPFLMVSGRADYAVSIFGAMVAPESIRDLFAGDRRVRRFTVTTEDAGTHASLWVHIELPKGTTLTPQERQALVEHYGIVVLQRLLEINFDYRDAHAIHPEAVIPRVAVHDHESGPFASQVGSFKPKALT